MAELDGSHEPTGSRRRPIVGRYAAASEPTPSGVRRHRQRRGTCGAGCVIELVLVVRDGFRRIGARGQRGVSSGDGAVWPATVDAAVFPGRRSSRCRRSRWSSRLRRPRRIPGDRVASHDGEPMHVSGARATLAAAGLAESALQCPPALPGVQAAMLEWVRAGGGPSPVSHNCSGKHAAMLGTCAASGWATESYLELDHPLQQAIRRPSRRLPRADQRHGYRRLWCACACRYPARPRRVVRGLAAATSGPSDGGGDGDAPLPGPDRRFDARHQPACVTCRG